MRLALSFSRALALTRTPSLRGNLGELECAHRDELPAEALQIEDLVPGGGGGARFLAAIDFARNTHIRVVCVHRTPDNDACSLYRVEEQKH